MAHGLLVQQETSDKENKTKNVKQVTVKDRGRWYEEKYPLCIFMVSTCFNLNQYMYVCMFITVF